MIFEKISIGDFLLMASDAPGLSAKGLSISSPKKGEPLLISAICLSNEGRSFFIFNQLVAVGGPGSIEDSDDIFETIVLSGRVSDYLELQVGEPFHFQANWLGGGILVGPVQSVNLSGSDPSSLFRPCDAKVFKKRYRERVCEYVLELLFSTEGALCRLTPAPISPEFLEFSQVTSG